MTRKEISAGYKQIKTAWLREKSGPTVMFLLRTNGNHYSPLNIREMKEDFLQGKGRGIPDFVYDLPEEKKKK